MRRVAVLTVAAMVWVLVPLSAAPATGAAADGCLPTNGLMNLNDADDLLAGNVRVTSSVTVALGSGNINWAQTSLADGPARLLYSLKWVEELVREHRRTGNSAYLDRAVAIVLDFAADNPVDGGPDPSDAWYPMYAGQRATAIACVAAVSGDAGVRAALQTHGQWLAGQVDGLPAWNQAIDPHLGLLMAGCRLNNSGWKTQARNGFSRLISGMIDADGVLNEQAPGYGRFVWERWGVVEDTLADCGLSSPSTVTQRRAALLTWLAWMSQPDGTTTPLGDSYRTIVPPTPSGSPTAYTVPGGTTGTPPSGTVKVFDAGYVAGRDRWSSLSTSTYWTLRFGPGRDLHGHEDHTAVTFWADGREVLIDSGHGGYGNAAYRLALLGPEAHNVLMLPGIDFRIRRATTLTRSDSGSGWWFHEVEDDVYGIQGSKLVDAPRTRGVLVLPSDNIMVVQDRASRTQSGLFEQLWHLVPGATVTSSSRSRVTARHPSNAVDIHVVQVPLPGQSLPSGSTTVVEGQTNPTLGWYSEADGHKVPAPVVRMRRTGTSTRMVTLITTTPVGGSVGASVRSVAAGWAIDLNVAGTARTVGISTNGAMRKGEPEAGSVPPPAGAIPLTGDWDGDGDDERGWFHDGVFGLDPGDGGATLILGYGQAGDKPVVGDWDGDGIDSIGVVRGNRWLLRNKYVSGDEALDLVYGEPTDKPVVGDWDGDGDDTIGIVRGNRFILRNRYVSGNKALDLVYGDPSDTPVVGDWDGDGDDTIGIVRGNRFILRNRYVSGNTALDLVYGQASDVPLTGDWDGDGDDTIGIRRDRLWVLRNVYKKSAVDVVFDW